MSFRHLTACYRIRPIDGIPGLVGWYADSMGVIWGQDPRRGLFPIRINRAGRYPRAGSYHVHVLVARAFHGAPPSDATLCRHLNDRKQDNRPENVAYGTGADNHRDMVTNHGGHPLALSEPDKIVRAVALIRAGMSYRRIVVVTGVSLSSLYRLRARYCPEVRHPPGRKKSATEEIYI